MRPHLVMQPKSISKWFLFTPGILKDMQHAINKTNDKAECCSEIFICHYHGLSFIQQISLNSHPLLCSVDEMEGKCGDVGICSLITRQSFRYLLICVRENPVFYFVWILSHFLSSSELYHEIWRKRWLRNSVFIYFHPFHI